MPVWRRIPDLENGIRQGDIRLLTEDPFLIGMRPDEDLSDLHRAHRDQAWAVIQPLVERDDDALFVSEPMRRTN
jgi:hypothetical protein